MPFINTRDIATYYETYGCGLPIVFVHGGWVSQKMWQPQIDFFARDCRAITYDIRGHGKTGGSLRAKYTIELFADDLSALLIALEIKKPVICGISMGGMVAQVFAATYPDSLRALVLCDTAASSALDFSDRILKYVLAPKWFFLLLVRILGVKRYAGFAFWYARKTRGKHWVGTNKKVAEYEKKEMLTFDTVEFNKVFSAVYDFGLQQLSQIKVDTLVMNGEFESGAVFRHTRKILESVPNAVSAVIPDAGHTSNMENPAAFNATMQEFLEHLQTARPGKGK